MNCISNDDIVMLNNVLVGLYQNGIINKPLVAFGKECLGFQENGEFLNIIVHAEVDINDYINDVNEILTKVEDCREELEDYYFSVLSDVEKVVNNKDLLDNWYDTLEVYSGVIEIHKNGEISIEFVCGDCIYQEEVFVFSYKKSSGFDMWFDD